MLGLLRISTGSYNFLPINGFINKAYVAFNELLADLLYIEVFVFSLLKLLFTFVKLVVFTFV